MSTKIYDGIRFRSSDLLEIHAQLAAYRPVVAKAVEEATLRYVASLATDAIDKAALAGTGVESPIWYARQKLYERQEEIKRSGRRDPSIDFDFTITIMPYQGAVYGIVFCEQSGWKDAMLGAGFAEAFPYWNNTDPPEGFTDEAWDERGQLWNAILAQDEWDRPVGCGFTYDFLPPARYPAAEAALPFVPVLEKRARAQAFNRLIEAEYQRLLRAAQGGEPKPDPLRLVMAAERSLRTDDGNARVLAESERVVPLLPGITTDLLIDGLPAKAA
ncbi:hypothetical protein [Methylobacterium pseudosasicola]|uniref:Uncharacterized protein n=1 Tax=Methylobacterium pseudosasicola TaxID=582667 RepID=A0A1I4TZH0_9HYPH|nr:hypothetical protein [Methylobacterium pseudosasicola]SFM82164.1 hypothetical protein SAMN05192568_10613 [Methylobacterium pseudosasicola]